MTSYEIPAGRPEERFTEKYPLLSRTEAMFESARCIYCFDAPCIKSCPTSIDIPTFIRKIGTGNLRGSARTILKANLLGDSCAPPPALSSTRGTTVFTTVSSQTLRRVALSLSGHYFS